MVRNYEINTSAKSIHFRLFYFFSIQRTPFDSKNPIGFIIAITFQYITIAYGLHVIACVLSLGIGAFMFAMASTEEIKFALNTFNKVVNDQITPDNRLFILQQFAVFIHAHSIVKQLSELYN